MHQGNITVLPNWAKAARKNHESQGIDMESLVSQLLKIALIIIVPAVTKVAALAVNATVKIAFSRSEKDIFASHYLLFWRDVLTLNYFGNRRFLAWRDIA